MIRQIYSQIQDKPQYKTQKSQLSEALLFSCSQITDVSLVKWLQNGQIVPFETSAIWRPLLIGSNEIRVSLGPQFNHFLKFITQSFLVRPNLPQNFISIQTEYKFRFTLNSIMLRDFRRNIAVDFDHFQKSIFRCQLVQLLICDFALRIPARAEVDKSVAEPVLAKMCVELFQACEVFEVSVEESIRNFEH